MSDSILPHTRDIIRRMFVYTADKNYIVARSAFFDQLYEDFFWLSLHALERYFKAILLMNGKPAKKFGHDLLVLYEAVLSLDRRLAFGSLTRPPNIKIFWREETISVYLERLNRYGSADNRYGIYGYSLFLDDIFKVDQIVWSIRRFCRPFHSIIKRGMEGREVRIDWVDLLSKNITEWKLSTSTPIEKLLDDTKSGSRKDSFLHLNVPFSPEVSFSFEGWRLAGVNPPLLEYFNTLKNVSAAIETRKRSAKVLSWVRDNIKLATEDAKIINNILNTNADLLKD